MFRSAIVRSLRASVPRAAVKTPASFQIRSSPIAAQFTPSLVSQSIRFYSAPAGLSKDEIEGRIVNLLKNFDKVRQNVIFVGSQCANLYRTLHIHEFWLNQLINFHVLFRFPTPARSVSMTRHLPIGCPRHHHELNPGTSVTDTY